MTRPASAPFFLLLIIAYLGFISLGLPDTLIGVAWPSVRDAFGLPQSAVALIFVGVGCSYFLSSFFTGRLLSLAGIGVLLAASSALVSLGTFGYGLAPIWAVFAVCSVLHGIGSGAIDAGLNHYAASHFSARHMNWLHACYGVGATLGPLIMTAFIAHHRSWRAGYFAVGLILLSLAVLFAVTRRKWNGTDHATTATGEPARASIPAASMTETLRLPAAWLQIALFFVYTGLEVTAGQWSFTILAESRHFPKETAGICTAIYFGSLAGGRFLLGFIADRLGTDRLLRLSTVAGVAGTALFALDFTPLVSAAALALTGFGLAAIYPGLMAGTPARLGRRHSAHAVGFQVSGAMAGATILPGLSGLLAQRVGLEAVSAAAVGMAVAVLILHEMLLRIFGCPTMAPGQPERVRKQPTVSMEL